MNWPFFAAAELDLFAEQKLTVVLDLLAESGRLSRPLPPARKYIDERYFDRLEASGNSF